MKSLFIVLSCLLFLSNASNLKGVIGFGAQQPQYYYQQQQPSYAYMNPYYAQPTSTSTSNSLAGNTNTVSQNLPQGGSQSTSTNSYGQNYYTGTYPGSSSYPYVTGSQGAQAQVMLPTQTYAPVDTSRTDLLSALSIASQQQNAALAQAANANLLNQMFGTTTGINGIKSGVTSSGASVNNNMATTNNQNVGVNTVASQSSNANTNLNNNAISSGNNGLTAGYTTTNQGTVLDIKQSPYI